MRYLHGDSTPFSLNDNFLETLCVTTEACVALIDAEVKADEAARAIAYAEECTGAELARLAALRLSVEDALASCGATAQSASNVTEATARRLHEQARTTLEAAHVDVMTWRDGTIRAARASVPALAPIVEALLVRRQLPGTSWGFEWRAPVDGARGARAVLHARTTFGLVATFDATPPADHAWAAPVKVSSLERSCVIAMLANGWLRKPRLKDERLDRYYLVEAVGTAERAFLVLRKKARSPSPGIAISLRGTEAAPMTTAIRIDEGGKPVGDPAVLSGLANDAVQRLWARVEHAGLSLVAFRRHLRAATFENVEIAALRRPSELSRAFVDAIAPYVHELQQHSRTPGELALKRDLGDGKREEMFVNHADLARKIAPVPGAYRSVFDQLGLGDMTHKVEMHPRALQLLAQNVAPPSSRRGPPARRPPPLPRAITV